MPSIWRTESWRYVVGPQRPSPIWTLSAAAPARQSIAPNNAAIKYPVPDVWGTMSSTHARCTLQGNSFLFAVTVAANEDVTLDFDTSRLNGVTAGTTPTIACEMDGALLDLNGDTLNYKQLPNNVNSFTLTLKATPANGRRVFRVWIRSFEQASGSMLGTWGSGGSIPPVAVDITSLGIGPTSSMGTVARDVDYYADTMLVFGDSRACGVLAQEVFPTADATTSAANNSAYYAWAVLLRARLNCEVGFIAQGGIGWQIQNGTYQGGATANPPMYGASGAGTGELFATSHWNGNARTFSQTHKFLLIQLGANDSSITGAMVTGLISTLRTACGPDVRILQVVDPAQAQRTTILSALASPANAVYLVDFGSAIIDGSTPSTLSPDGSHLNRGGQQTWADDVFLAVDRAVLAKLLQRTVPTQHLLPLLVR